MVCDGHLNLLINSCCVMDISDLLIICVIVIMRIYSYYCNYPFEHKQLVDLLFIFPVELAMDVQRRLVFNGVY
jgi:hypothetical protein